MLSSFKPLALAFCATAGLAFVTAPVFAEQLPGLTKDELKCESSTGGVLSKFTGAKSKCITKCVAAKRKLNATDYSACFSPYSDPATQTCIDDSVKGAATKAGAGIVKACTKDCPECYDGTKCTDGTKNNPFVVSTEAAIDGFVPLIDCTEAGGATPSKDQAKCEDGTSKALVKFVGSVTKCYSKCQSNAFAGKNTVASCTPDPITQQVSDPATQTCVSKASTKSQTGIDKVCTVTTKPPCIAFNGSQWTGAALAAVNATNSTVACGSPSGAFLN